MTIDRPLFAALEHNPNWPQVPNHPHKTLIIGGSASGKTNSLFSLLCHQPDIDKIYLYAKNPYETNYQLLINKGKGAGFKHYNDSKALIEYSNDIDIYENIEEYNPNNQRKILIIFDDMMIFLVKKLNPIVTESFIRGKKLNFSLIFITQSYFLVPRNIKLNSIHFHYENSE